jgi:hypothetical protein
MAKICYTNSSNKQKIMPDTPSSHNPNQHKYLPIGVDTEGRSLNTRAYELYTQYKLQEVAAKRAHKLADVKKQASDDSRDFLRTVRTTGMAELVDDVKEAEKRHRREQEAFGAADVARTAADDKLKARAWDGYVHYTANKDAYQEQALEEAAKLHPDITFGQAALQAEVEVQLPQPAPDQPQQ